MFNPRPNTIPAAWRPVCLALGATLVAILVSQTLSAISAYEQGPLPVGLTTTQESEGLPGIVPAPGPPSHLLPIGQPQVRSLVSPEPMKPGDMQSEDAREDLPAAGRQVTGLDYGGSARVLAVGRGPNETTSEPTTRLTARQSRKALGGSPYTELAPLLDQDNLIRVFHFRNSTRDWQFYDPRPAFTAANTLVDLQDHLLAEGQERPECHP
jgi:hypothetical protein